MRDAWAREWKMFDIVKRAYFDPNLYSEKVPKFDG
jgi:hypothetical protein